MECALSLVSAAWMVSVVMESGTEILNLMSQKTLQQAVVLAAVFVTHRLPQLLDVLPRQPETDTQPEQQSVNTTQQAIIYNGQLTLTMQGSTLVVRI